METQNIQFYDAYSILVVGTSGTIRRIHCPFRIICIQFLRKFKPGVTLWVAQVVTNTKGELIYIIYDAPYHYSYFKIAVSM